MSESLQFTSVSSESDYKNLKALWESRSNLNANSLKKTVNNTKKEEIQVTDEKVKTTVQTRPKPPVPPRPHPPRRSKSFSEIDKKTVQHISASASDSLVKRTRAETEKILVPLPPKQSQTALPSVSLQSSMEKNSQSPSKTPPLSIEPSPTSSPLRTKKSGTLPSLVRLIRKNSSENSLKISEPILKEKQPPVAPLSHSAENNSVSDGKKANRGSPENELEAPKQERRRHITRKESEVIQFRFEEYFEACQEKLKLLEKQLAYIKTSSQKTETLIFPLIGMLTRMSSELKETAKKNCLDFNTALIIGGNISELSTAHKEAESLINEITHKMCEFGSIIEQVKKTLQQDIVIKEQASAKDHGANNEIKFADFLKALVNFTSGNASRLRNRLSQFKTHIFADREEAAKTFEELTAYFKSLFDLTEAFIRTFGLRSLSITSKGAPIYITYEDRYKKEARRSMEDAMGMLGRELSQYAGLFLDLEKALDKILILKRGESNELPEIYLQEKEMPSNCRKIAFYVKELQTNLNSHLSLFLTKEEMEKNSQGEKKSNENPNSV